MTDERHGRGDDGADEDFGAEPQNLETPNSQFPTPKTRASPKSRDLGVGSWTGTGSGVCLLLGFHQLVTELFHGDQGVDQHRQLFAQPADVHVHRPRAAGVVIAPDVGEEQVARQHAPPVLQQVLQQQELLGGELDFLAVVA